MKKIPPPPPTAALNPRQAAMIMRPPILSPEQVACEKIIQQADRQLNNCRPGSTIKVAHKRVRTSVKHLQSLYSVLCSVRFKNPRDRDYYDILQYNKIEYLKQNIKEILSGTEYAPPLKRRKTDTSDSAPRLNQKLTLFENFSPAMKKVVAQIGRPPPPPPPFSKPKTPPKPPPKYNPPLPPQRPAHSTDHSRNVHQVYFELVPGDKKFIKAREEVVATALTIPWIHATVINELNKPHPKKLLKIEVDRTTVCEIYKEVASTREVNASGFIKTKVNGTQPFQLKTTVEINNKEIELHLDFKMTSKDKIPPEVFYRDGDINTITGLPRRIPHITKDNLNALFLNFPGPYSGRLAKEFNQTMWEHKAPYPGVEITAEESINEFKKLGNNPKFRTKGKASSEDKLIGLAPIVIQSTIKTTHQKQKNYNLQGSKKILPPLVQQTVAETSKHKRFSTLQYWQRDFKEEKKQLTNQQRQAIGHEIFRPSGRSTEPKKLGSENIYARLFNSRYSVSVNDPELFNFFVDYCYKKGYISPNETIRAFIGCIGLGPSLIAGLKNPKVEAIKGIDPHEFMQSKIFKTTNEKNAELFQNAGFGVEAKKPLTPFYEATVYETLVKAFSPLVPKTDPSKFVVEDEAIEDYELKKEEKNHFNFSFFSPPYGCLEEYPGKKQSYLRHWDKSKNNAGLNNWFNKFIIPLLKKTLLALQTRSPIIIQIIPHLGKRTAGATADKFELYKKITDYLLSNGATRLAHFKEGSKRGISKERFHLWRKGYAHSFKFVRSRPRRNNIREGEAKLFLENGRWHACLLADGKQQNDTIKLSTKVSNNRKILNSLHSKSNNNLTIAERAQIFEIINSAGDRQFNKSNNVAPPPSMTV